MIHFLNKFSNWKSIVPLLLLFMVFSSYLFPAYQVRINRVSSGKVEPLDTRFSYSYHEVLRDFDAMGSDGRSIYRIVVGEIDMVYPWVYGPLIILVFAYLLKQVFPASRRMVLLALVPLVAMVFDYLENLNTLLLLDHFPDFAADWVSRGVVFTQTKFIILGASLLTIGILTLIVLIRRIRVRTNG